MKQKKFYIVLEGIVGCGKSTQAELLYKWLVKNYPDKKIVRTFEPGGSEIANNIRKAVQATVYQEEMEAVCEAYLYAASRAQTLRKIVKPALNRGEVVLSDRSVLTSISYQGFGRGLGADKIMKINKVATEEVWPELAIFIDTGMKTALARAKDKLGDKFETMGEDFFSKCRKGYKWMVQYFDNIKRVDGEGTPEEVHARIIKVIKKYYG